MPILKHLYKGIILCVCLLGIAGKSYAIPDGAGNEVFPSVNVGIGTKTPQTALAITNGNLGIGTWTATQALDVKGNITATGTITGTTISGTINPSALEVTGQTTLNTSSGNTGIGTTLTGGNTAKLAIIGGNVGIGTITPQASLVVTNGNVGVGTWTAAQALDVKGTVKMTGFVLTSSPSNGYVLTSDASGNGSWSAASGSSQWFTASGLGIGTYDKVGLGTNLTGQTAKLAIVGGNVGIGTVDAQGAFVVTNGNVGIGTWAPAGLLDIPAGQLKVVSGGVIVGCGNNSASNSSLAAGCTTTASGNFSFVSAQTGTASGNYSAAIGTNVVASNTVAIAIGSSATASGSPSFAIGNGVTASGTTATAMGESTTAASYDSFTLGRYNIGGGTAGSWVATDPLLEVGIGTGTGASAANAFTILKNGNVGVGTSIPASMVAIVGNVGIGTIVYSPFMTTTAPTGGMIVEGNVGVGTTSPQTKFSVVGGNVGLGTWTASSGRLIVIGGNVGIATITPGTTLDVGGALRATSYSGLTANYLPKASSTVGFSNSLIMDNGVNVGINSSAPGQTLEINGGLIVQGSGDSYLSSGNFGVGTTTPQTAFVVSNGNVGIGTWTSSSGLQMKSSFAWYRTATAASVTSAAQTIIGVTSTASARTITLATADVTVGRVIIVKDESGGAGTNNITVNTEGGQTIDGAASITISANYGVLRVYSDGSNWFTF